jgi:hypothetical protein
MSLIIRERISYPLSIGIPVQVPLVENGYRHPEYYYYGYQAVVS